MIFSEIISTPISNLFRPQKSVSERLDIHQIERRVRQRIAKQQRRAQQLALLSVAFWLVGFLAYTLFILPQVAYALFPQGTERLAQALGTNVQEEESRFGTEIYKVKQEPVVVEYVPPFNPDLPEENRLIIDKIGVNTVIGEGEDWEKVLEDGVWRAPDFGDPEDRRLPVLLAAHRFGYIYWSNQYRRENSFFNLPKLEVGDRITVIWNQREYEYEIYEGYTDTQLRNLNGDLILFTCEVLNSERRIVRVARLVVPDLET